MEDGKCFIAVHAGAGYHSLKREPEYRKTCSKACQAAMKLLNTGKSAIDAVAEAVQKLEDASCTNAGVGSSLTLEGTVECDASIMDGRTLKFGAVGAISNVKNPVKVAKRLVEEQTKGNLSLGRVPPSCMVGAGATKWAKRHGIPTVSHDHMLTDQAVKTFEDHKRRLEAAEIKLRRKRKHKCTEDSSDQQNSPSLVKASRLQADSVSDTVGAICVDHYGNVAAAVSSGGVSLKQPGRIGPAACYGAGCWAVNAGAGGSPGVAVATSGTGEQLMSTLLAQQCVDCLQQQDDAMTACQLTFTRKFLDSPYLKGIEELYAGILALRSETLDTGGHQCELVWGHSTDSMCVGYMTSGSKPKTVISRMAPRENPGKTFVMEGQFFTL